LEGMTGTALLGGVSNPVPASRGLRRLESQLPERRPRVGDSHETDKRSAQDVDFALSPQLSLLDRTNQIHLCERKCCTMRLIKYELFLLNTIICVWWFFFFLFVFFFIFFFFFFFFFFYFFFFFFFFFFFLIFFFFVFIFFFFFFRFFFFLWVLL
jgi:hypothetical protein